MDFCFVVFLFCFFLYFGARSRRAHQKNKYSLLNKIKGPGRAASIYLWHTHCWRGNSRRAYYTQFYFISPSSIHLESRRSPIYARTHTLAYMSWHLERLCMPVWCPVRRCVYTTFWLGAWDFRYVLCDAPAINAIPFSGCLFFFNRFNSSIRLRVIRISLHSTGTTVCTRSFSTVLWTHNWIILLCTRLHYTDVLFSAAR